MLKRGRTTHLQADNNFDNGDCNGTLTKCPCEREWLGDGYCDAHLGCDIAICGNDFGDCKPCAENCPRAWQGDGHCDVECSNAACGDDSFPVTYGCMDSAALNFNMLATVGIANGRQVRPPPTKTGNIPARAH